VIKLILICECGIFLGATLDGGKKYSQKVEQAFHLTTAALKVPVPPNGNSFFERYYNPARI